MKSTLHRIVIILTAAWLPILLITVWWVWSANSVNPFFPPLSAIWEQFKFLWIFDQFPIHVLPSLRNLFSGLLIGVVVGLLGGAYLGTSKTAARYFEPAIDFLRSIPPVATVPIFIVIFGLDTTMRTAAVSVSAMFPVLLATIQGVRGTDPTLMDTATVFRLSPTRVLWRVRMPAAGPTIFSGLQIALQVAFIVTIASELFGTGFGLGAFTLIATESFLILDAWTGVIFLGILGYTLNLGFDLIERIVLRWYYAQRSVA